MFRNNKSFIVSLLQSIKLIWINSNLFIWNILYITPLTNFMPLIPMLILFLKSFNFMTHHQIIGYAYTALWTESTRFLKIVYLILIHKDRWIMPFLLWWFFIKFIFNLIPRIFKMICHWILKLFRFEIMWIVFTVPNRKVCIFFWIEETIHFVKWIVNSHVL